MNNTVDENEDTGNYYNGTKSTESKNELNEFNDWKKDIEKSIEKISERVASNNSNVLVNLLEKRINDINSEANKLRKSFEDTVDNTSIIKKNIDKFERSERLISQLLNQISEMKNTSLKWQSDFLKNINDVNEKVSQQQILIEQFENYENIISKKVDQVSTSMNKIQAAMAQEKDSDNKLRDSVNLIEENLKLLSTEDKNISSKLNSEIVKLEGNHC